MLRALLTLTTLSMTACADRPSPLSDYQWKHRLILVSTDNPEVLKTACRQLEKLRTGVLDRDLKVIDVSTQAMTTPGIERPESSKVDPIRKWAKIYSDQPASFILIGKDGAIKARQTGALDLKQFFALIDTMPMRKREMRKDAEP